MTALSTNNARAERSNKERIPVFDGIRGLSASLVIVAHVAFATIVLSSAAGPPREGFWSIIAAGNDLAIGPFFVMSGLFLYRPFVRYTMAGDKYPHLGKFFARRAARLLPAVWLLAAVSLVALNWSSIQGFWYVVRPFLLMQVYDYTYYAGMDVAWTVPTEAQFYLALPLLAWIGHLFAKGADTPRKKARRMIAPLLALIPIQLAWVAYVHIAFDPWPPQYFYPLGMTGVLTIGMAFAVWNVLAELSPQDTPRSFGFARRHPNLLWAGLLVVFAINCLKPFATPGTADWVSAEAAVTHSILFLLFSYLVMLPLVVPGAASKLMKVVLANPVSRYLGRISYGLYLWHFPVMYVVFGSGSLFEETYLPVQTLLGKFGFWELFVLTFLGTLAVASVSYWLVERPIVNWVQRKTATRKRVDDNFIPPSQPALTSV
ncbi:acyltransferase family protein [Actinophytocola gossypii]|uniref:Acyltransferase n=1 Tax=Actinophytocola gossypii TaxID=2812003 RepID=A0ABT2JG11_9PSEU|nr:acyltransferase [Actinophytocola gossypii]MCT2586798.1 acyltransferase [Actinophytocola gossypii]